MVKDDEARFLDPHLQFRVHELASVYQKTVEKEY